MVEMGWVGDREAGERGAGKGGGDGVPLPRLSTVGASDAVIQHAGGMGDSILHSRSSLFLACCMRRAHSVSLHRSAV